MNTKQKILLIVGTQIALIVSSFLILVIIESDMLAIGNSIDHAGLNRFLTANIMSDFYSSIYQNQPFSEKSLDSLKNNLVLLKNGGIGENSHIRPLPEELTPYWMDVQNEFLIFEKNIQTYSSSQVKTIELESRVEQSSKNLLKNSNILVLELSKFLDKIDNMLIQLQLIFLFVNTFVHIFFIVLLFRIFKKDSEEKIKLEKFATIGKLGSSIAHDLRNPLTVIKGSFDILKLKKEKPFTELEEKQYNKINNSINKIEYLTRDILDFSRESSLVKEKTSFLKLLNSSINEIQISKNVEFILPDHDFEIYVDKVKFQTVITNLIKNANDAIVDKGTIKILLKKEPKNIIITIQDTGDALEKSNLKSIFEPLFTTKVTGTGLGLASCDRIIKLHGGKISAFVKPTRFVISIPT